MLELSKQQQVEMEAPFLLNPLFILKQGLQWCNVQETRYDRRNMKFNVAVFKSFFGKHPLHLARVWRDLQVYNIMTVAEARTRLAFQGFLLGNCFLKLYEKAHVRNARFDVNHVTLKELTWTFVERISELRLHKIRCPTEWPAKIGGSVDGTQARTNEPRDPNMRRNPKNYAYKYNFAGLNYQVVLSIWTNEVWYVNAGDPGSVHDMTAIREEFVAMVPDGCRVVADSGYSGKSELEKRIFAVNNPLDPPEVKAFKAAVKSRQEHFNKRIKDYECLTKRFIHGVDKHAVCFMACCVLVQYAIEDTSIHGEPLNQI